MVRTPFDSSRSRIVLKAGRVSIRSAPRTYAKSAGVEIVEEYYDEAVSGADMIDTRPGPAQP